MRQKKMQRNFKCPLKLLKEENESMKKKRGWSNDEVEALTEMCETLKYCFMCNNLCTSIKVNTERVC